MFLLLCACICAHIEHIKYSHLSAFNGQLQFSSGCYIPVWKVFFLLLSLWTPSCPHTGSVRIQESVWGGLWALQRLQTVSHYSTQPTGLSKQPNLSVFLAANVLNSLDKVKDLFSAPVGGLLCPATQWRSPCGPGSPTVHHTPGTAAPGILDEVCGDGLDDHTGRPHS